MQVSKKIKARKHACTAYLQKASAEHYQNFFALVKEKKQQNNHKTQKQPWVCLVGETAP